VIDADGHLRIIDRAKDVGRLTAAPCSRPTTSRTSSSSSADQGSGVLWRWRDRVCAFINIDFDAVGNWAERKGLPYAGYVDLAGKPEVLAMMKECVEKVNADLAGEEGMAATQIARFLVLHKELDPDDDELPHAQGAPRLHRREVRRAGGRPVRRARRAVHRDRGEVRGRAQRHGVGHAQDPGRQARP
jgi:long-chain acyl-CoA synthetase